MSCSHSRLRHSLPLLVSMLALVVALGGTSYAAVRIHGNQLKNGTVANKALKSKTIKGAKVRNDAITGKQVREATLAQVPSAARATTVDDGAIGAAEMATVTRRTATNLVTGFSVNAATATCLPGELPIGGGSEGSNDFRVVSSHAVGTSAWEVVVHNTGPSSDLTTHVYCLAP